MNRHTSHDDIKKLTKYYNKLNSTLSGSKSMCSERRTYQLKLHEYIKKLEKQKVDTRNILSVLQRGGNDELELASSKIDELNDILEKNQRELQNIIIPAILKRISDLNNEISRAREAIDTTAVDASTTSDTKEALDKIREELEKAKLETSEAQRQLDTEKSEKQINATRYDETIKAIKQRLTDVIQPQLSKLSADAFKPILDALQNVGVRPITGGYRSEVLNVRRIY